MKAFFSHFFKPSVQQIVRRALALRPRGAIPNDVLVLTSLDRMIGLVEGAIRQRTPNEIALTRLLSVITLIFVIVVVPLWAMALNASNS